MASFKLTMDRVRVVTDFFPEKLARKIAREEVETTIANTLSKWAAGKNVRGGALKPGGYSESYKAAIKRALTSRTFKTGKRAGETITKPRKVSELTIGERDGSYFRQRTKTRRNDPLSKKGGNLTPNLRLSGDLAESFRGFDLKGGVGAEGRFDGGGRGRSMSNADLLAHHISKNGFVDPIGFGDDDTKRINERFGREIGEAFAKAIKVERGR